MQYLAVFRKHIPGDSLHELHQTMDGIEEVWQTTITFPQILFKIVFVSFQLCELLKIKQNLPYNLPAPVEPALEANEGAASYGKHQEKRQAAAVEQTPNVVKIPAGSVPPLQVAQTIPHRAHISDAQVKREFVRTIQLENQNFEIQARNEDVILPTTSARAETPNGSKARYEIPDDYITRTAAKIIGNRKELEMREFLASKKAHAASVNESNDSSPVPIVDPSGERQPSPNDE